MTKKKQKQHPLLNWSLPRLRASRDEAQRYKVLFAGEAKWMSYHTFNIMAPLSVASPLLIWSSLFHNPLSSLQIYKVNRGAGCSLLPPPPTRLWGWAASISAFSSVCLYKASSIMQRPPTPLHMVEALARFSYSLHSKIKLLRAQRCIRTNIARHC